MASVTYNVPLSGLSFVTTGTGTGSSSGFTLINGSSTQTYMGFGLTYGNIGGINVLPISGTIQSVSLAAGGVLQYTISSLNVNAGQVGTAILSGADALANLLLAGDDTFSGTGGNDTLDSRSGNDIVFAGAGDDIVIGGSGNDAMIGGPGDDQYVDVGTSDAVIENPGEGTDAISTSVSYVLPANVENLTFTGAGDIAGTGNDLANVINGSAGDNVLDGGAGADTLIGWVGNDIFVIDNASDVAVEQPGAGIDTLRSGIVNLSLAGFSNIENIDLTGSANLDATGDGLANAITGNSGSNRIDGGAGADQMKGGAGSDTYVVDNAGDQVTEWNLPPAARTISVGAGGTQGNDQSKQVVLSGDGGKAVFLSLASNFAVGDSPGTYDLFLKDVQGGAVTRVDTDANGAPAALSAASGLAFALTPDAHYLVFATATSLSGGDTGGVDVYRKDLQTGAVVLVSRDAGGNALAHDSETIGSLDISNDGRYVAFTMVNGVEKAWVKDLQTGTLTEASTASDGTATNASSFDVALSGDGHYIAFASYGDNLVLGDQDGTSDIFLKNLQTGATTRVGVNQGFAASSPVISSDGRYVAFLLNNQIYYDDTTDGAFPAQLGGTGVHFLAMSDDGRFLAFTANEPNFSSAFGQAAFVRDMQNGSTTVRLDGLTGQRFSDGNQSVRLSADGHFVGIASTENIVVPGDANNTYDTFLMLNPLADPPAFGLVDTGGTDTVESSFSYTLGLNLENLTLLDSGGAISATGNAGDNVLKGNSFDNVLTGELGNDTYVVNNAGDVVVENPNEGTDAVQSAITYTLSSNLENLTLTGTGNINGTGNAADNVLAGNSGVNVLTGGLGNDTYVIDASDAVVESSGEGTDTVQSSFTYTLPSNVENLTLTGTGNLDGTGDGGNNALTGNMGNNTLNGAGGDDVIKGGHGRDALLDGLGNDTVDGGSGNDVFTVDVGNNTLAGGWGYDVASFGRPKADYTITRVNGAFQVVSADGTTTASGVERLTFTGGSVSLTGSVQPSSGADFNGDGYADLVLRNADGSAGVWLMNGANIGSAALFPSLPLNWDIVGSGDFNGDGRGDVLWRNSAGDIGPWLMNGASLTTAAIAGNVPTDWTVAGTGDFNGDSRSDILFRNDSGQVGLWFMNGTAIGGGAIAGTVPLDWNIVGTGDFDGDHKADILWRNDQDQVGVWLMNGSTIASYGIAATVPTNWTVAGTGDFNGDNRTDVLWHSDTGVTGIWQMNGAALGDYAVVGSIPTNWTVAAVGDFNGDHRADIAWREDAGMVGEWFMNGMTIAQTGSPATVSQDWLVT